MAIRDGNVWRKIFPPSNHETSSLAHDIGPMQLDPMNPRKNPKPCTDPDLFEASPPTGIIGLKGPQKLAERANIVKKLLTLKNDTCRWKHQARTKTMPKMPTQTARAKKHSIEKGRKKWITLRSHVYLDWWTNYSLHICNYWIWGRGCCN